MIELLADDDEMEGVDVGALIADAMRADAMAEAIRHRERAESAAMAEVEAIGKQYEGALVGWSAVMGSIGIPAVPSS